MKKIFVILLFAGLLLNLNQVVFSSEEDNKLSANASYDKLLEVKLKDPNLIEIPKIQNINQEKYKQKVADDAKKYANNKKDLTEEQQDLYEILDKILRGNNLQYQNWRIGINIAVEDVNASAGAANLIVVNSSLYDSLFNNVDALAFVISHELAHLILGHNQKGLENSYRIQRLEQNIASYQQGINREDSLASVNRALGNYMGSVSNNASSLGYSAGLAAATVQLNKIYEQERLLEIEADKEAIALMVRAGYNPNKAYDAFEFLSRLPNIYTKRSTHPDVATRRNKIEKEMELLDIDYLTSIGNQNLFKTNVSQLKKSSDKKTIVLLSCADVASNKYIPESQANKNLQKAYRAYLKKDMATAKEYFKTVFALDKENYIPALYLSYVNEYLYLTNKDKKSLKLAKKWARKAEKLSKQNEAVLAQKQDLAKLLDEVKLDKGEDKD